ncbi:hypothetical protein EC973_007670 [Apophysomyces ossiformis]|uniref:Condensation domain-containing protein n=1 Tax=Apophysomyces ossiformis TaxID=679940 RepID=A0A8H7BSU5_9FUNG|nr:hypothetical protein EC973_007670 [Apophysomyces ossiformis]
MSKEIPVILRKLGDSEKFHVSRMLERTHANVTITAKLKHTSRSETPCKQFYLDTLYPAIAKLLEIHPRLAITIAEADQPSAHFIHLSSLDMSDIVRVYEEPDLPNVQEVIAQECRTNFDFHSPLPLWRLRVDVHSPQLEECHITLTMHHAIGDGMSLLFFWQDLVKYLDDPSSKVHPDNYRLKPKCESLAPPFEQRQPPKMTARVFAGAICEVFVNKLPKPLAKRFKHNWEGDYPVKSGFGYSEVRLVQLDGEVWQSLVSRAKQHGISVHAALNTAMVLAWAELYPGRRVQTSTAVNCRRLCNPPVGHEMGNFVGEYDYGWKPKDFRKGFWTLAKQYHETLHQNKSIAALKVLLLGYLEDYPREYQAYWKELRDSHQLGRSGGLCLSDLGKCTFENKHWDVQGVWFSQSAFTMTVPIVVSAITVNGCMRATVVWQKGALDATKADAFPGHWLDRLRKASSEQ